MRYVPLTFLLLGLLAGPARAVEKSAIDDAIERGVAGLKKAQGVGGKWGNPQEFIGATALAGLTLLECGADKDDKAVAAAAQAVRKVALTTTHTYSRAFRSSSSRGRREAWLISARMAMSYPP